MSSSSTSPPPSKPAYPRRSLSGKTSYVDLSKDSEDESVDMDRDVDMISEDVEVKARSSSSKRKRVSSISILGFFLRAYGNTLVGVVAWFPPHAVLIHIHPGDRP